MFVARGAFPNARKNLQKALRAAERRGLREPQGMAAHDLFTVAAECNNATEAQEYAARALRAYGPAHATVPSLAYDVAFFWVLQGRFADALPVLRAAVPRMRPEHRPYGQAGLARAAGALGNEVTFDTAWAVISSMPDDTAGKADALIGAARGAVSLSRWDLAEQAGQAALTLAQRRGQSKVIFEAEALLESAEMGRRASNPQPQPQSIPVFCEAEASSASVLVQQFVQSLEAGAVA
jgi:tetratricopeptide (TPR) repeat protein